MEKGDWVRSYESGIWQIFRVLHYVGKDVVSGSEQQRTTIFSKRFLLDTLKHSFKTECCDSSLIEKLDPATLRKLTKFIEENQGLYEEFRKYNPKPIDSVYNARIRVPDGSGIEAVESCLKTSRSLTEFEIEQYLRDFGFNPDGNPHCTVQFVSRDHACKDGYLIFQFRRVLET